MKRYEKLLKHPREREEHVLAFWGKNDTFEKSLARTRDGPRYVFFEGPPTANGKPHFGHLMPRVYKDLFPRYKTMQGYYVARKGGWDTHGLPVELEVEKEIGVNSKSEIEAYGVERFVERCKASVWRYKAEWERMIERMGFWIDLENAYVTYTDDYIETVWWELKTMFDRGLLYQGHKTLPYCPRCGTGLSSHEVAQGYRRVEDPSVTIRMPVASDDESDDTREPETDVSLLTWTTTPWTLPANVALAVSAEAPYVEVEHLGERFIVAKALVEHVFDEEVRVVRELAGRELIGLRYEPPYRLTSDPASHRVYGAAFVNLEEGTGIVHIASAFGEDDYQLGQEVGLPFVQPVDTAGRFTTAFSLCAGQFVKDADPRILEDLSVRGLVFRQTGYEHDYPFCWRCDTPLLYYAMDSWYVRTTAVKEQMIESNRSIRWYPEHVGRGRLGDFLANLKDWALSRDRYWGTPLNLWVCGECQQVTAVGSRAELVENAVDRDLAARVEFHRPYIDRVLLRCPACGETMQRVPYVIDTWFDSGSMHTAQWHYPFENEDRFADSFPADFICEAIEQTRGWFYTLLATSTIVHGQAPYRNCVGTGLGLDENGLKMSKSRGNVIDVWGMIDAYGADCIRWHLCSSSAPWKTRRLSDTGVGESLYRFLDTLRNTYDFFALYASIDGYAPESHDVRKGTRTALDHWIDSRLAATVQSVTDGLDVYDVLEATAALEQFVDDLSNWYVRLSRRRFWRGGMGEDKAVAYGTLRRVLVDLCKLLAPFIPFLAESIYQQLRTDDEPESVHLCDYPVAGLPDRDLHLEENMDLARRIVAVGHQARHKAEIKVRQPLSRALVDPGYALVLSDEVQRLVEIELNVDNVEWEASFDAYSDEVPVPNFESLGRRLGASAQNAGRWIRSQSADTLRKAFASGSLSVEIDGQAVDLLPEDVTYTRPVREGFVRADGEGVRLLLDVRVDDGLRRRGWVREVVHRIQIARKDAGFAVTDRIVLSYEADAELSAILAESEAEVASEVLATKVVHGRLGAHEYSCALELDGHPLAIGLQRSEGR
jgi:isoleucyl-tRNA synthetase